MIYSTPSVNGRILTAVYHRRVRGSYQSLSSVRSYENEMNQSQPNRQRSSQALASSCVTSDPTHIHRSCERSPCVRISDRFFHGTRLHNYAEGAQNKNATRRCGTELYQVMAALPNIGVEKRRAVLSNYKADI